MKRFQWLVIPGLLLSLCALAQKAPIAYSAEEITQVSQVLSDGTKIHTETHVKLYHDSMGRFRRESGDNAVIFDPVNDAMYVLDLKNQTAQKLTFEVNYDPTPVPPQKGDGVVYVTASPAARGYRYSASLSLPASGRGGVSSMSTNGGFAGSGSVDTPTEAPTGAALNQIKEQFASQIGSWRERSAPPASASRPSPGEQLGTQTFDGIVARGMRFTRTVAEGEIGNDRAFQTVEENWGTQELGGLTVLSKTIDPHYGDRTMRLVNIMRGNPDISVFQVPPGFKIQ